MSGSFNASMRTTIGRMCVKDMAMTRTNVRALAAVFLKAQIVWKMRDSAWMSMMLSWSSLSPTLIQWKMKMRMRASMIPWILMNRHSPRQGSCRSSRSPHLQVTENGRCCAIHVEHMHQVKMQDPRLAKQTLARVLAKLNAWKLTAVV